MNAHPLNCLALVLAVALTASGEAPSTWRVLEKLLAQEGLNPEPPSGPTPGGLPSDRTFLFDDVLALTPENLLQGAAYVVARNPAPAPGDAALQEAYVRQVNQELQAVLEYYPLLARDKADFARLIDVISSGKQPALLRRFLLRQCAPGSAEGSALSRYFEGQLDDGAPVFQDTLIALLQLPTEDGELQELAVNVMAVLIPNSFRWTLAHDKEAAAVEKKAGKPVDIRTVLDAPGSMALERPTLVRIEQQRQRAGTLAAILSATAKDTSRPATLRARAGEESARLYAQYPLPGPQEVQPPPPPIPQPVEN